MTKAKQCETVMFLGHKVPIVFDEMPERGKQSVVFSERHWLFLPRERFEATTSGDLHNLIADATGATPQAAAKRLEAKCHAQFRRFGAALGYDVDA